VHESVQRNPALIAAWSAHEYLALVKFLLLHSDVKMDCPAVTAIKDTCAHFWTKAGEFIKKLD